MFVIDMLLQICIKELVFRKNTDWEHPGDSTLTPAALGTFFLGGITTLQLRHKEGAVVTKP